MRYIPIIVLSSLLAGCGSDSGSTSNTPDSNSPPITIPEGENDSSVPSPEDPPIEESPDSSFETQMLSSINVFRAQEQNCGGQMMPAVPALTWNYDLEAAAYRHSSDMANANFMDHTGSDGSDPGQRIADTGYVANAWAENVAAGQSTINAVMTSWMNSPGHCMNIMNSNVTEVGASAVENSDTRYGIYWTQVFANHR